MWSVWCLNPNNHHPPPSHACPQGLLWTGPPPPRWLTLLQQTCPPFWSDWRSCTWLTMASRTWLLCSWPGCLLSGPSFCKVGITVFLQCKVVSRVFVHCKLGFTVFMHCKIGFTVFMHCKLGSTESLNDSCYSRLESCYTLQVCVLSLRKAWYCRQWDHTCRWAGRATIS